MFIAAKVAEENGCNHATIFTVDSDVAILACFYSLKLQGSLSVQIGCGNNLRILDVTKSDLTLGLKEVLSSLHALSGHIKSSLYCLWFAWS